MNNFFEKKFEKLVKENFNFNLTENLRKYINIKFKSEEDFADFINEKPNIVKMWSKGESLPNLYRTYEICEKMGITTDSLITGKKPDLSDIDIDYDTFDKVIELVNDFARKHRIKKITSEDYFNMYYAVISWNEDIEEKNKRRISTNDAFEILEDLILSHLRKNYIPR